MIKEQARSIILKGREGRPTYPCTPNILQKKNHTHTQTNKDLTQYDGILCLGLKCVAYFQIVS